MCGIYRGKFYIQVTSGRQTIVADLTYKQKPGQEKHKLRIIVGRDGRPNPLCGIGISYEKVETLLGCYFTTEVRGTTIILQSGVAPQVKK
jgi:hypothetical protein